MRNILILLVIAFVSMIGCDVPTSILPEPRPDSGVGGSSSSVSSSGSTSSGNGGSNQGAGGGLSCDPCEQTDGSRIVRNFVTTTSTDGLRVQQYAGLYDKSRGEVCNSGYADDGILRCLPFGMTGEVFYSDSACTVHVGTVAMSQCAGGMLPKYITTVVANQAPCTSQQMAIYAIGAQYSGSLYTKSGANCSASAGIPGYSQFTLGAKVGASAFAALVQKTDLP